jgi:hypothetical protein
MFVQVGVINTHVPVYLILFGYKNGVSKPLGM